MSNPTTKITPRIFKFQRAFDKKYLFIKQLRKNSPRYWPKDAQIRSIKEKSRSKGAQFCQKVLDFEIRNSKRVDKWKALWKYQLGQLNGIEKTADGKILSNRQEKQFSRDWYWSYETSKRIIFQGWVFMAGLSGTYIMSIQS